MARLAAMEKGEYYPTPLDVVQYVADHIEPPQGSRGVVRVFDPCCGAGMALETLAQSLKKRTNRPVETWGVEISPDRAREAQTRLDVVLQSPFEAVTWNHVRRGVCSVMFLNPPYDQNDRGGRMELDFLKLAMPAMVPGSALVYVIPITAIDYNLTEYLYRHFEDVNVFRFGDEAAGVGRYDRFKQIVVLATRRKDSLTYLYRDPEAQEAANAFCQAYSPLYARQHDRPLEDRVPVALPEDVVYTVPVARKNARMRRYRYTAEEIADLVADRWSEVETRIAEMTLSSAQVMPQPLKPPKTGHIAQIVAAGLTDVMETDGQVFKGRVVKVVDTPEPDPRKENREIERERFETHVVSLSPQGLHHLSSPAAVESFLQRHADVFKRYINEHFQAYGNTVTPEERRILDTHSLDKKLPGVEKAGLLPRQREDAVALTRAIERYGVAHHIAEMGFGVRPASCWYESQPQAVTVAGLQQDPIEPTSTF